LEALIYSLALARESEWTNGEAQHKLAAARAMRLLFSLWIFPPPSGITHGIWNHLKVEFFSRSYIDHSAFSADAIVVNRIALVFTAIMRCMEDACVVNGYDFQQQARLFWHADLGNLSTFLEALGRSRTLRTYRIGRVEKKTTSDV
jgi:hypothetical protein